ncbi:discoidin domain-containing protein [bacterium]|nr:MAG: discoidin domain-containing protein [bacterium]
MSYITDGNNNSRWISVDASPVTLTADLGTVYQLSKVSINWAGDTVKNFQIQVSTNNSNWTTIITGQTSNVTPEYRDYVGFQLPPLAAIFALLVSTVGIRAMAILSGRLEFMAHSTWLHTATHASSHASTDQYTPRHYATNNPTPAPVAPAITAFQAIPSSVAMGGQTTLYWSATSANAGCSISLAVRLV